MKCPECGEADQVLHATSEDGDYDLYYCWSCEHRWER